MRVFAVGRLHASRTCSPAAGRGVAIAELEQITALSVPPAPSVLRFGRPGARSVVLHRAIWKSGAGSYRQPRGGAATDGGAPGFSREDIPRRVLPRPEASLSMAERECFRRKYSARDAAGTLFEANPLKRRSPRLRAREYRRKGRAVYGADKTANSSIRRLTWHPRVVIWAGRARARCRHDQGQTRGSRRRSPRRGAGHAPAGNENDREHTAPGTLAEKHTAGR